jgi:enoyl-CoA hydratase/carnithine racemase
MGDATTSTEGVLLARNGDTAIVTLNREDKLNALTKAMWTELGQVIRDLAADDALRCIVLRGAGTKAFSPGNDINEFETERSNIAQARDYGALMHATLEAIASCPVPSVAMIHGICVGGGLEIAGSCDIRVCGQSSRFGVPVAKLGLVMAYPELDGLIRLVGRTRALEILLEARIYDAEEAQAMGIVTRVVADDAVEAASLEAARRIAEGAPLVHRWHKKFATRLLDPTPLGKHELDEGFACFGTEDFLAGRRSFVDKTKPKFKGR